MFKILDPKTGSGFFLFRTSNPYKPAPFLPQKAH